MADDSLLEAVRGLHLAHPELGPKPLLAKLRQQQPDLAVGNKEVREALAALKAEESKATEPAAAPTASAAPSAAAAPPASEERGALPNVAISLACFRRRRDNFNVELWTKRAAIENEIYE